MALYDLVAMIIIPLCLSFLLLLLYYYYITQRSQKVFLLDFSCYKPPMDLMCTNEYIIEQVRRSGFYTEEILSYMKKIQNISGLGDSTYMVKALLDYPVHPCLEEARKEAEMVIFGSIDNLLEKTKVNIQDIRVVIVNCTIFNAVPSLSSMIMNRYKLRDNIACYNLSGMGCTAGLWAISMAKQLLQVNHNSYALVVSTENVTQNCYFGNDHSKFLINCVFRVGGAAIMLSNRTSDAKSSKYQLIHTVHTHTGFSDQSYNSIFQDEDDEGLRGVSVNKDLLLAAINAIEINLTLLGRLILPISEKVLFLKHFLVKRILNMKGHQKKKYVPKFNTSVEHFFPHVGGKPVLDELQKVLGFSDAIMEAARMTLYRFGNTSSSSVWYEVAYAEAKGRIKKGDRLWQMAFGSGFKCCSVVWRAMRSVSDEETNPWSKEIDEYPLNLNISGACPYEFNTSK